MKKALIQLDNVDLIYPIYSIKAQSLRTSVFNLAIGGRLLKSNQDVIHIQALSEVTLTLNEGDRLGLVGCNGSGKSSLLKVAAGVYEPTRGSVHVNGRISSMLDINLGVDWEASGRENIFFLGRVRGLSESTIKANLEEIIDFSGLGPYIDLPMKTYSAGMGARLIFAITTSFEPDILILDEWLSAGDAEFMAKAAARMSGLFNRARSLIFASHSVELVRATCNKVCAMRGGRVEYFGDVENYFANQ